MFPRERAAIPTGTQPEDPRPSTSSGRISDVGLREASVVVVGPGLKTAQDLRSPVVHPLRSRPRPVSGRWNCNHMRGEPRIPETELVTGLGVDEVFLPAFVDLVRHNLSLDPRQPETPRAYRHG